MWLVIGHDMNAETVSLTVGYVASLAIVGKYHVESTWLAWAYHAIYSMKMGYPPKWLDELGDRVTTLQPSPTLLKMGFVGMLLQFCQLWPIQRHERVLQRMLSSDPCDDSEPMLGWFVWTTSTTALQSLAKTSTPSSRDQQWVLLNMIAI